MCVCARAQGEGDDGGAHQGAGGGIVKEGWVVYKDECIQFAVD